jgi:hypothetical protein
VIPHVGINSRNESWQDGCRGGHDRERERQRGARHERARWRTDELHDKEADDHEGAARGDDPLEQRFGIGTDDVGERQRGAADHDHGRGEGGEANDKH